MLEYVPSGTLTETLTHYINEPRIMFTATPK
jgi:hypothetical protein